MRKPEADDNQEIKSPEDLLGVYSINPPNSEGMPARQWRTLTSKMLERAVYKSTSCGAWAKVLYEGEGFRAIGVEIGSIVEKSEAEVGPKEILFPFTLGQWRDLVKEVEDEANRIWIECNYIR